MRHDASPNPEDIERLCWRLLDSAAALPGNRESPQAASGFRLPVLATISSDGLPAARTIVLRQADRDSRTLRFHTDRRSPKVREIQARRTGCLVFYDEAAAMQLRLEATLAARTEGEDVDSLWNSSPESSLRCYLGPLAPGTPGDSAETNLPRKFEQQLPTRQELLTGRTNFCLLCADITSAEALLLNREGNICLRWKYNENHQPTGFSWHAP